MSDRPSGVGSARPAAYQPINDPDGDAAQRRDQASFDRKQARLMRHRIFNPREWELHSIIGNFIITK